MKVYCGKCKHLIASYWAGLAVCGKGENRIDTFMSRKLGEAAIINKSNDCPYFEEDPNTLTKKPKKRHSWWKFWRR